jgi:hypothetical protein
MALSYDSLQAIIQKKYMPKLYDNIFVKKHPLTAILKKKAKTFNGRKFSVPVEYAAGGELKWGAQHAENDLTPPVSDPFTLAEYVPSMMTGSLKFTKEEELIMNSEGAVKNIVEAKVKNLQKNIEKEYVTNLWARSATSGAWNRIEDVVGVAAFAGIPASGNVPAWWKSNVLAVAAFSDATGDVGDSGIDHIDEDDMLAKGQNTYIGKLLARGVAQSRAQNGEDPDLIVCPQYLWDLIEHELDPRKTGSRMHEKLGSMGFTALDFRGIGIVADQDMASAQAGDTDGRIYFLNTDYLYMFYNSGAKFTAGKFIEDRRSNTSSVKVHTYGNLACSNRGAHTVITDLYSDKDYA